MVVKAHNFHLLQNRPAAMATNYDPNTNTVSRKRSGDIYESLLLNQGMIEIKNLLQQHMQKSNLETAELSKKQLNRLYMAIGSLFSKKLKMKDGEIERIAEMNRNLERKLCDLANEIQLWQNFAQSNAAEANILRAKLEQIWANKIENDLIRHIDEAESCCSGGETENKKVQRNFNVCRYCRNKASSVLLLPCRHLCLCDSCVDDPMVVLCPACGADRKGAFKVNLV